MIITQLIAQLSINTQKRPSIWQSYLLPHKLVVDLAKITPTFDEVNLVDVVKRHKINEDRARITLSVGDGFLIDPTKFSNHTDNSKAFISLESAGLDNVSHDGGIINDYTSVSIGLQDTQLQAWGVYAQVLDENHARFTLSVGNHSLYEEES